MTSLYDITRWYKHKGLVGEEKLALVQTVIAISGKPLGFGLEAPAGSGKTATMDLLVGDAGGADDSLIKKQYIYFKDAGSDKAFWYDPAINQSKIIVFKELQKDKSSDTIEAIKSLTEGKSARRNVTVAAEDTVKEQKIDPKTVMYTLAIENDTKPDAELRRRCITMSTDVSKEQTGAVLDLKAQLRWDKDSIKIMDDNKANEIRRNVNSFLLMNFKVVNPFAQEFAKIIADVAPDQKIRSMAEHLWDVVEGVTKINHLLNPIYVGAGNDTIITNIQDIYQTLTIYKDSFLRDVYSIPPLGDIVLQGFNDAKSVDATKKGPSNVDLSKFAIDTGSNEWIDVNHLRKAIKEKQKVVLAKNVVNMICRQLVDAGYLEDAKIDNVIKYQVQEKFRAFETPDFDRLLSAASKLVKEKYPAQYQRWYDFQFKSYQDPITGQTITHKQQPEGVDIDDSLI
jgi:hypothetical protein